MHARRARRAHTRVQTNFVDWPGGHAPTDRTIKGYMSRVYQWYFIFHAAIVDFLASASNGILSLIGSLVYQATSSNDHDAWQ